MSDFEPITHRSVSAVLEAAETHRKHVENVNCF